MAKKKWFKLLSLRKKKRGRPKKKTLFWKLLLAFFVFFVIIPTIIAYMWFKKNILDKLPNVNKIENVVFSQTTTITDKNWVVLYKVFNENRKYVNLDKISPNIQNALISIEDKNFWKNPWIDIYWIIRAGLHDVFLGKRQWASTLTQQIIKNLILTRDKTITRKLKEIVLAFELNSYLSDKIQKQYKSLSEKEVKRKVKERILEMYLNYVFFWNNAYWVEAASNTYFHKKASGLSVLESAVLAWIPKSPVKYDPVNYRKNNLWYLEAYTLSWEKLNLTWSIKNKVIDAYISYLNDQSFSLKDNESDIVSILAWKKLKFKLLDIRYKPWRKDFVLARMYLDGYINKAQFIEAVKEWFTKEIFKPKIEIKAPHFVFYVLNKLEKEYWKEVISKAWWTIKTSLDYNIQKIAEQTVTDWSKYLEKKWANNTALLYIDSKNWDIISYVGSKNYYDKDIDWQVDIITSKRQCGSVIKPLIYTKAFIENKYFTPESPIYDTELKIADRWNTFNNFDGKFLWLLPIKKALPYSRNIPAAKMYYLWWWETKVKSFLQSIWLNTLSNKIYYGYPLAIWAAEVRMLDLAQAYSHLSNIDNAVKINPILEIKWPNWSIIYKKENCTMKQIIPKSVISLLWNILSDPNNRPAWWNLTMQIKGLKLATKSWTTNIIDRKTKRKYPRDGWFIGYSPSKVFIAWAWNTKWEHMHADAYGGWTAWKVWNDFVKRLQKQNKIKKEEMKANGTTTIYLNTINWKKSSQYTPVQVSKKTMVRIKWIPPEDDGKTIKMIEIDTLCNWLVSEYTPITDRKYAYIINTHSYRPNDKRWEEWVQKWWKTDWKEKYEKILWWPVLFEEPTSICEDRLVIAKKWKLKFNVSYPKANQTLSYVFDVRVNIANAPFKISKYQYFIDNQLVWEWVYSSNILWIYLKKDITNWLHKLKIRLIDEKWYIDEKEFNITLKSKDIDKPYLDKVLENNWKYTYIFKDKSSRVLWWYLICDWVKKRFRWPIVIWNSNDCKYSMVIDYYSNSASN